MIQIQIVLKTKCFAIRFTIVLQWPYVSKYQVGVLQPIADERRPFDYMKSNVGDVILSLFSVITTRLAEARCSCLLEYYHRARARCFVLWFGPDEVL